MIITQLINSNPYFISSGMATKVIGQSLPEVTPASINEFCYCEYECDYVEKVFGSTDNDFWKNDKNVFLFRRLIPNDTVEIKLFKDDVELDIIDDDTYGEFIDGYVNGTAEQQLYINFILDWQKVFQALGGGNYQVKTEVTLLGNSETIESQKFNLMSYSDLSANGTVRIEYYDNGNIEGSEFDFTGLNIYNSFRCIGELREVSLEIEDDSYLDTSSKRTQITKKIIPKWTLKTGRLDRKTSLAISRNSVLANKLLVTDYNIINEDVFRRKSLIIEGIEKVDGPKDTRAMYDLTLSDKIENLRKRNN